MLTFRRALPSLVTLLGAVLSFGWVAGSFPLVCGWVGLVLDACDGALARRIDAVSAWGGAFDRQVDEGAAHVGLALHGAPWWAFVALVALQATTRVRQWRFSGRAALFVALLGYESLAWWRA